MQATPVPLLPSHRNNFDFLRLLFATFVLITHSYPLTGVTEADILAQVSHGQTSLSYIGVRGFLLISGFLITKSLLASKSLKDYLFKRAVRVFPAMWLTLALTVLLAFFVSGKSIGPYLIHYSSRDYLIFNAVFKVQYFIDGVFMHNPFPRYVNGSLWTIQYEVFFYIVLGACYFLRKHRTAMLVVLTTFFVSGVAVQLGQTNWGPG
ncbi:acyltransferase family protein [Hymenobacter sp. BT491]|uniref:acyltransferase family protein n=1 Tax=Hymenobacter sp. BT491 TaxID=2766779 RepID=UPI00165388E8|nr:acyltransferase [Hymenobacter sp. BT491]MBC6989911.1 acyltransferase [Hymenobacter sp. BT491]